MAERRVTFIVGANIRNFQKGIQNASKGLKNFGRKAERTGKNLSRSLTGPILAIGTGLIALQKSTGNYADELLDLSEITGISTDALQEWRNVSRIAGVETDALANAASGLSRRLRGIGEESGAAFDAAEQLGINFKNASGEIRDTDSIMSDAISRLSEMEPGLERAGLAGDLFGRRWEQIAPILGMTAQEIDHARQEAHDLGMVLDGEALKAANEFRQAFEKLQERITFAAHKLAIDFMPIVKKELIPMLESGMEKLQGLANRFRSLDMEAQKNALTLAAVAVAAGPALVIFGKLARVVAALISPLALKIGLVAALAAGFTYVVKNADAFQDHMRFIMNRALRFVSDGVSGMLKRLAEFAAWTGQTELAMGIFQMTASIQSSMNDINLDKPTTEFQNFGEFFNSVKDNMGDGLQWLTDRFFQFGNDVESALDIDVQSFGAGIGMNQSLGRSGPTPPPPRRASTPVSGDGDIRSIASYNEELANLQQALRNVTSSEEFNLLRDKIADLEMQMEGTTQAGNFLANVTQGWVESFGQGMSNIILAGERFIDILKDMKKLLLSSAIQSAISALLTGGLGGSGFFGTGGGLFGRVLGVNDALIRSDGSVIKFHPNDDILAMQDFGNLVPNNTRVNTTSSPSDPRPIVIHNVMEMDSMVVWRSQQKLDRRRTT